MRRLLLPAVLASLTLAAGALAATAPYIPWPSLLQPLPTAHNPQPGPVAGCAHISVGCSERNLAHLNTLVSELGCDHLAVFATTYQQTTKTVIAAISAHKPRFSDPTWILAIDALFHDYYYQALKDYRAGRTVPGAWRIAFEVAASGDANATKDMLLGVNAHVNRDLPYVLATVGLHTPVGKSRKRDWDVFNIVLNDAYSPVVQTVTNRYDPSVKLTNPDTVIDGEAGLQLFQAWRELAFRHAEQLLNARTPRERRLVEREIEVQATAVAREVAGIPNAAGYRQYRDAYCAAAAASTGTTPPFRQRL